MGYASSLLTSLSRSGACPPGDPNTTPVPSSSKHRAGSFEHGRQRAQQERRPCSEHEQRHCQGHEECAVNSCLACSVEAQAGQKGEGQQQAAWERGWRAHVAAVRHKEQMPDIVALYEKGADEFHQLMKVYLQRPCHHGQLSGPVSLGWGVHLIAHHAAAFMRGDSPLFCLLDCASFSLETVNSSIKTIMSSRTSGGGHSLAKRVEQAAQVLRRLSVV